MKHEFIRWQIDEEKTKMSTKQDLVSIIVPVYNIENYLPRCLETIAAQTYRNLEIILVNDGSTDGSGCICDEFARKDGRATVIHQLNQGLWAARNAGQRVAKGEYLMFVDSDDYLHQDAVKTMYDYINKDGEYEIAIVNFKKTRSLNEDIYIRTTVQTTVLSQEELIAQIHKREVYGYMWNKLYRRSTITNICSRSFTRHQDFDFNLRVYLKIKKAIFIDQTLYFYMQRTDSLANNPKTAILSQACFTKILFVNYSDLNSFNRKLYGHHLLRKLYRKMVFLKGRNYGANQQDSEINRCREYEKETRKAYWRNRHIPLYEKIGVTVLLHSPRLTRWLMKKTKNW